MDARGRVKAPWYVLRRVLAPVALLVTDEGLNGLRLHVMNDLPEELVGEVAVELVADGERTVEEVRAPVRVGGRDHLTLDAGSLFEGFRDLTFAYRFGVPDHDLVVATLRNGEGSTLSEVSFLPLGLGRPVEPDVGLRAVARPAGEGGWMLDCSTRRLAQSVVVDVPGFVPSDSWFDLAPGRTRTVHLCSTGDRLSPPRDPSSPERSSASTARGAGHDNGTGPVVSERAVWFGLPERPLFGWLHMPDDGRAKGGVVLCPTLGVEAMSHASRLPRTGHQPRRSRLCGAPVRLRGHRRFGRRRNRPSTREAWLASIELAMDLVRSTPSTWVRGIADRRKPTRPSWPVL